MFETIVFLLLVGIICFMGYIIYLMTEQIDQFEEVVEQYGEWMETFAETLSEADAKMKVIDKKGSFSSDDEIGFAYKTIRECIEQLNQIGEAYGGQTEGREEVQGQEEEE